MIENVPIIYKRIPPRMGFVGMFFLCVLDAVEVKSFWDFFEESLDLFMGNTSWWGGLVSPVLLTTRISIALEGFACQASPSPDGGFGEVGAGAAGRAVRFAGAGSVGGLGLRAERVASGERRPIWASSTRLAGSEQ